MGGEQQPVMVGVDGTVASELAIAWGIAEARSRRAPLRLVHVYPLPVGSAPLRPGTRDQSTIRVRAGARPRLGSTAADPYALAAEAAGVLADAVAATRGRAADLAVTGETVAGDRVAGLLAKSAGAELLVIGARGVGRLTGAVLGSVNTRVSADADCPVVVVRGLAGYPEGHVVVGVDGGAQSDSVLEFAFDHACRRGLPVRAVLCRRPPRTPRRIPDGRHAHGFGPAGAEAFGRGGRAESATFLTAALARWQDKYPDVLVEQRVVEEHAIDGLVEESLQAQLLVVGGAGSRTGGLGSVSQGVLHHATSPVAVVHAPRLVREGGMSDPVPAASSVA
jgi:nucleotide-binding universal stress UspA family protein